MSSVSVAEAAEDVSQPNRILVDVRTRPEYEAGHARGAVSMPMGSWSNADLAKLQQYERVYVICQSGGRSAMATKALAGSGVHAINVSGGTMTWHALGLPMA